MPEDFIYFPPWEERGAGERCMARLGQIPSLLLPPRPPSAHSTSPSWEMCLPPAPRASVVLAINDGLRLPELWGNRGCSLQVSVARSALARREMLSCPSSAGSGRSSRSNRCLCGAALRVSHRHKIISIFIQRVNELCSVKG